MINMGAPERRESHRDKSGGEGDAIGAVGPNLGSVDAPRPSQNVSAGFRRWVSALVAKAANQRQWAARSELQGFTRLLPRTRRAKPMNRTPLRTQR